MNLYQNYVALLGVTLESPDSMILRGKVHLLCGNSLLRAPSYQHFNGKSKSLFEIFPNCECRQRLAPLFKFGSLKYRERDGLQNVFRFWLAEEGHVFQIQQHYAERLKKLMGVGDDHRDGAFDWDLNMILKGRQSQQISSQAGNIDSTKSTEYRYRRETGIAFTYPEYEYSKPNKTAAGPVHYAGNYIHRAYVDDMQTGPFSACGLISTDERLLLSTHDQNDYRPIDVTEDNLLE
uniref:Dynein assembly factor 3 C-terminal domain-containing protein n=1 Tax=Glossina morsitans morsitans TaxID=37546 RepID=A0A1B0FDV5_GLOMM